MDPSNQNELDHTPSNGIHYYPKFEIWSIQKKMWDYPFNECIFGEGGELHPQRFIKIALVIGVISIL